MERLSAQQVVEYLANQCPDLDDGALDVIRKAKVTGKRAVKYANDSWSKIGLALGDVLEVVEAIKDYVPPTGKENTAPRNNHISVQIKQSQPSNVQSLKVHQASSNRSTFCEDEDNEEERFECLKQHLSPNEFAELSTDVKESYLAAKENYEYGLQQKVSIALPSFMAPKKSVSKQKTVIPSDTSEAESRMSVKVPSQLSVEVSDKAGTSSDTGNGSRSPFMEVGSDDNDDDNRDAGATVSAIANPSVCPPGKQRRKRQRLVDTLDNDELTKKLPKYDIEAILTSKGGKEKDLLVPLKADGIVYEKERKLLMRTLSRHLFYDEKGIFDDSKFVKTDEKSGMAASVVAAYPLFADNSDPNKRPWWRIFNPAGPSGYIANCIVGIQRAMKPSERVRGGGQGKLVEVTENDAGPSEPTDYNDPDAEWMSLTMPYESQKAQLIQGMKNSFSIRRKWIMNIGPSITEILSKYLHLVSYETEMLELEFNTMYPDKAMLFLQNFPPLVNAVLRINGRGTIEVDVLGKGDERDIIEACLFLASKLPRPNLKRFSGGRKTESVMPVQETLLACLPRGINVKDYVKERREKCKGPVQPYLLALVPKAQVTMLYIVVDSYFIDLKTSSVLKGLDILFKVFFVFNVHFPLGWKMFWGMIENGIFKLTPNKLTNSAKEILLKYKVN